MLMPPRSLLLGRQVRDEVAVTRMQYELHRLDLGLARMRPQPRQSRQHEPHHQPPAAVADDSPPERERLDERHGLEAADLDDGALAPAPSLAEQERNENDDDRDPDAGGNHVA